MPRRSGVTRRDNWPRNSDWLPSELWQPRAPRALLRWQVHAFFQMLLFGSAIRLGCLVAVLYEKSNRAWRLKQTPRWPKIIDRIERALSGCFKGLFNISERRQLSSKFGSVLPLLPSSLFSLLSSSSQSVPDSSTSRTSRKDVKQMTWIRWWILHSNFAQTKVPFRRDLSLVPKIYSMAISHFERAGCTELY